MAVGKRGRKAKRIKSRDQIIKKGLSLREIAEIEGVSYQAISEYIMKTEQYGIWAEAKRKRQDKS